MQNNSKTNQLLIKFICKLQELTSSTNLWVAYSGGQDSRVLLELCHQAVAELNKEYRTITPETVKSEKYILHAIHIDHGLHPDSNLWAEHCKQVCARLGIALHVVPVKLMPKPGFSLEAMARNARRKVWHELLPTGAALLLAHHQDDQVETILHRLFRGAGPTGLSGMSERSNFASGELIRPLLTFAKQDILDFASYSKEQSINGQLDLANYNKEHGTRSWIVDPSNQDCKYDRNFIRHKILPVLRTRWHQVNANIERSGQLCHEVASFSEAIAVQKVTELSGSVSGTLAVAKLLALDSAEFALILRQWIKQHKLSSSIKEKNTPIAKQYEQSFGVEKKTAPNKYLLDEFLLSPSKQHIARIRQEVLLAGIDAQPCLKIANYEFRRYRDDLYLIDDMELELNAKAVVLDWRLDLHVQSTQELIINLDGASGMKVNGTSGMGARRNFRIRSELFVGQGLKAAAIQEVTLQVIVGKSRGERAKKIFQAHAIPQWQRFRYPQIFCANRLIAIVGLWVLPELRALENQEGLVFSLGDQD